MNELPNKNELPIVIFKSNEDYSDFETESKGYGVQLSDWLYIKQRLLLDERVKPSLTEVDEVRIYVRSLRNLW